MSANQPNAYRDLFYRHYKAHVHCLQ